MTTNNDKDKLFLEACEYLGLDPVKCLPNVEGVPPLHQEATISTVKLFIISDYKNRNFKPDYTDGNQPKFEPWVKMGSCSGPVFELHDCDGWDSDSRCGARLCSGTSEDTESMFEDAKELYRDVFVYERDNKANYARNN